MKKGRYYKNGEQVALITVSQAVYDNETGRTVKQDLDAIGPKCDQAEEDIAEIKKEFVETDTISLTATQVVGLIPTSTAIDTNASWNLYYIKVNQGDVIAGTSSGSVRYCYTTAEPADGVSVTGYVSASKNTFNATTITIESDGYFCVGIKGNGTCTFVQHNNSLAHRVKELEELCEPLPSAIATAQSDIEGLKQTTEQEFTGIAGTATFTTTTTETISYKMTSVKLEGGHNYRLKVSGGLGTAFAQYSIYGYTAPNNYSDVIASGCTSDEIEFVFPSGFENLFFRVNSIPSSAVDVTLTIYDVESLSEKVEDLINKVNPIAQSDYDCKFPSYIYHINNDGNPYRNIVQKIRLEGLICSFSNLDINGGGVMRLAAPTANTANTDIISKHIELSGLGLATKSANFDLLVTKASAMSGVKPILLAIGDSWCAAKEVNMETGESTGVWNYTSQVVNEAIKLSMDANDDEIKIMAIGYTAYSRDGEYNGETYNIRSADEGRGGWAAQSYLRMPCNVRTEGAGLFSEKAAWDAIGLGRKIPYGQTYDETADYEDYTADVAHRTEYLTTAMGYYHWDYSAELYEVCGGSDTYTGSSTQKALIDTYMEDLLDNPINPFYDRSLAVSSQGDYAFSLAKYIERYKTLDTDGETRLVIGSTAGSRIRTTAMLNNWDVLAPTHVTIELGTNEYKGLSIAQMAADIMQLATLVTSYDSSIKVGICQVHNPLAINPDKHIGECIPRMRDGYMTTYLAGKMYPLNKALSEALPSADGTDNIYYVPTYYVMGASGAVGYYGEDVNGNKILISGKNDLHPTLAVYKEIGYQILCWIAYTCAQS